MICSLGGEAISVRGQRESDERSSHSKTYGVATHSVAEKGGEQGRGRQYGQIFKPL